MKMGLDRITKLSLAAIILFLIFVLVGFLNLFLKDLPVVVSISILVIAVAVTILVLGEIEGFLLFIGAIILIVLFVITFDLKLTVTSSAVLIGIMVILLTFIS